MEGPVPSQDYVLPASAGIGHVHLRVSDLEASIAFYRDVLGFRVMTRFGNEAAFLSAGGYHHHLGLNTWESARGPKPRRDATGLYHFALRFPDRRTLGLAMRRDSIKHFAKDVSMGAVTPLPATVTRRK